MRWNIDDIRFLYPPDDFLGTFTNEKMQQRHEAAQKMKIDAILTEMSETDDPVAAMHALNPRSHINFLMNNIEFFKASDCFEKTVLKLYYRKNTPFIGTDDLDTWIKFFELCDPKKLYELGSPVSNNELTVYRGSVTGIYKGLSWTSSKEQADWFLKRWQDKDMGGGTVYSMLVSRDDILVHIVDDLRQEIILKPEKLDTIKPTLIENT